VSIRLGTAGWVFEPWRKSFYPDGLPQKQELAFASARLGAIEINATFYSHQKPESFATWAAATPAEFRFAVKGHQFVTHIKKLKDVEVPLANFFGSGVLALGSKLGPFCWQLPGNLTYSEERVESFLRLLPQTPEALVALARNADDRLKRPPFLDAGGVGSIRHALEVRHPSFAAPGFVALLRRYNVALVVADTADWPYLDQTADFAYCRLQGAPGAERYSDAERDERARWLGAWADGADPGAGPLIAPQIVTGPRDVFAFFVSTDKEHAPMNARAVMQRLNIKGPGE
jgi:uncharacterized protein YecE (DUF72 family)